MVAARVNGLTLEYEVTGQGTPLLLVHGLGTQMVLWPEPFVQMFVDRGFQVIRYDNRDIGLSTKLDAPAPTRREMISAAVFPKRAHASYLLADMADDGIALLDHLGVDRTHVVGVSMGGMIAQTMAIHHRRRVASLTSIMSNTGDRRHGRISAAMLRKLPKALADPEQRSVEHAIERSVAMHQLLGGPHFEEGPMRELFSLAAERHVDIEGTARQAMAIAASPDRTPGLRTLELPTLVVHGLLDQLVLPSGGVATAKAITGSRLLAFPDMAHDLPRVRWPEIVDAIVANTRR